MDKNNYPDIDFGALRKAIDDKSRSLLNEVNEENLKYFSEETKKIAEATMENYIFHVYDLYSDGARKITDISLLEQFTNYSSGYQGQMLKWNEGHPIVLTEQTISIPAEPKGPEKVLSPTPVLAIGTAVAVGLFIFTNVWVALAAELLAAALSYRQVVAKKQADIKFAAKKAEYERAIKKLKQDLVLGLINELEEWLKLGKAASDAILKSYNL